MGSASDFGGKLDLVTAGRSSSQGWREGANGHRILLTPLARLSGMSESILHYHLILTVGPQNSQPLHHPRCSNTEKIPRVPSSWKPESKITNVSRGQHMFPVRSTLYADGTVRQASSYLFLRMKLLLENLKLCCGTHDMLVPILLGSGGGLHHSEKP